MVQVAFAAVSVQEDIQLRKKRLEINEKVSEKLKGHTTSDETRHKMSSNHARYWQGKERVELKGENGFSKTKYLCKQLHPTKKCQKCNSSGNVKYLAKLCITCKCEYIGSYTVECRFKFNLYEHVDKFDFHLIEKYGWYKASNRGDNPNGVSRDHMFSVKEGFLKNIPPSIISHPANCRLVRHKENMIKGAKSIITIEELYERIKNF